jgi:hypothetical protein
MTKSTLTPQAINRLIEAPIKVSLWNGCFNRAMATAEFAKHRFELAVEVTHPLLHWQCGDKNETSLVKWKSHEGMPVEIPESLNAKIALMVAAATMTKEEAEKLSARNKASYANSMDEMGFTGQTTK